MSKTDLGDRMKAYESLETGRKFMPGAPVCIRLDGRGFSKWTRGLRRPYDPRMSDAMVKTAISLVAETQALVGYTQSDEISLLLYSDSHRRPIFFEGRISKLTSVIASMATAIFNRIVSETIPRNPPAMFDCRVWQVPTKEEAANVFLWRELDASKNSVSMAAHTLYSHKELHRKSGPNMQEMLHAKGQNWNDFPPFFKRGTFVQRQAFERVFTTREIDLLPANHGARENPELRYVRHEVLALDMPKFSTVTNRVQVLFEGQAPITEAKCND